MPYTISLYLLYNNCIKEKSTHLPTFSQSQVNFYDIFDLLRKKKSVVVYLFIVQVGHNPLCQTWWPTRYIKELPRLLQVAPQTFEQHRPLKSE